MSAAITVAYALSPIDLVPDFVPVLGYLDDVILLPLLEALTVKFIPKETLKNIVKKSKECGKQQTEEMVLCDTYYHCLGIFSTYSFETNILIIQQLLRIS